MVVEDDYLSAQSFAESFIELRAFEVSRVVYVDDNKQRIGASLCERLLLVDERCFVFGGRRKRLGEGGKIHVRGIVYYDICRLTQLAGELSHADSGTDTVIVGAGMAHNEHVGALGNMFFDGS